MGEDQPLERRTTDTAILDKLEAYGETFDDVSKIVNPLKALVVTLVFIAFGGGVWITKYNAMSEDGSPALKAFKAQMEAQNRDFRDSLQKIAADFHESVSLLKQHDDETDRRVDRLEHK